MSETPNQSNATKSDGSSNAGRRIIKRYANRKLYDTRDSRYITLAQVAEFVRAGEDIKIIDNKSKEDLTSVTLAQVIYYEEERKETGTKRDHSINSLRSLIQSEGQRLVASLRDKAAGRFHGTRGGSEAPSEGDSDRPRRSVMGYPKELFEELQSVVDERMRMLVASAISPIHQLQNEVQRLAKRIEELEGRLKSVAEKKNRPSAVPRLEDSEE